MRCSLPATLHVAYLVNQYPKVSHSFIRREILALEKRGIRVERFALRGSGDALPDPADEAERKATRYVLDGGVTRLVIACFRCAARAPLDFLGALLLALRVAWRSDRPPTRHVAYFLEACVLKIWLEEAQVQHLHAHFGTNSAEVALLARALGGPPFSFTVHGPEEFDKPEFLHLATKGEHAEFIVAVSAYGRSQLYRWLRPGTWPKIAVVRCGLDEEFYRNAASSVPALPRFVCVGRLCEQKGQLVALEALAILKQGGVDCELVLAGDGEMRSVLEERIAVLGLSDNVRITGWLSSAAVREELLAARALVLPSFAEGLPVAIMESMALGRPVISTYVAGIPELVRPGLDGWLVQPSDTAALAAALEQCARASREALETMGASARARVLERHDVDSEAAVLAKLFASSAQAGQQATSRPSAAPAL
jgi:glycosyltransferase involved in cell wall biosynthesis